MKRDIDQIRSILFEMESSRYNHFEERLALNGILERGTDTEKGRANQVRAEHVRWMIDDGLLSLVSGCSNYVRVTAKGCDFLDAVRDEGVWERTKRQVAEIGGNTTIEFVRTLAVGFLRKQVEQRAGLVL
ncbi:DUF2513 domain-containing protein [Paracoccus sp. MC1862]|uniref:DUF2513 domain-containing protein n=1 Tax=Paracoccus sp. MC1862 TaxID=2760307 RepID=UPI0016018EFF|nr:DUF2513 domain-containing protein [Paracoccus sp. MC1862]MBB1497031.1 DUF2513 domain-containing protein [Paracoccus sp. MC1862]QQO44565.1 DUF2513 domain-containing protein [Paracoccus sp. MC1862]